jgi:hypothetical protein
LALSNVEKKVGVTVNVDASGALRAWKEYQTETKRSQKSTEDLAKSEAALRKQINERSKHMAAAARHQAKLDAEVAAARKKATDDFKQRTNDNLVAIGRFTAGMGIAAVAVDKLSQRHLQNANVTRNLKISIEAAREATQGFVTDMDLSRSAALATSFGVVKTDEDFARLAATSQKLATRLGTDTATAMSDLTTAISRQSPMILDNLGITLKMTEAHEMYARELRKSVKDLTDVEKREAFRYAALKKAEEATRDVKVTTEGSASSIQRFKVAMTNATDTVLGWGFAIADNKGVQGFVSAISGAVGPLVDFGKALGDAHDEVKDFLPTTVDLSKGLTAVREATGSLVSPTTKLTQGVHALANAYNSLVGDDIASKLQQSLNIVNDSVDGMRKSNLLQFQSAEITKAALHDLEVEEKLHRAIGANEADLLNIQTRKYAVLKEEAALRFDMFEVMRLIREEESAAFDFAPKKGGAGGDKFKRQRAEFEAQLAGSQRAAGFDAMNRDDMTARGEFDEQLGIAQRNQAVADAQAQYNAQIEAAEKEHLKKLEEERKKAHDAQVKRIAEETKAREAAIRRQQQMHNVISSLSQQSIGLAEEVAVAVAGSERKRTLIMQGFQASQATAIGVMETVKAAAAFAALNPIQGAMHTGAAALAFAKAGLLAGGVIGPGAGGGGGGGGGGASSGFGGGGSSGGQSRGASGQSAPISRKGEQHAPPTAAGGGGGFSGTINFNSYLPADEEKMGVAIRRAIKHSADSFGSAD